MSQLQAFDMLLPIGRMVQGSLYKPNTTDAENRPLVVKSGPNAGQPRVDYYVAIAIPKEPGHTHWAHTEWGKRIWDFGHASWPQGQAQRQDFAWKITDGDSTIPNKQGKKPCDMVGHAGHWIVKLSGGYAPKIVNKDGSAAILEENAVRPGYFVQAYINVDSNRSTQTAGIYLNHRIIALSAFGEEISFGPDASAVGFGAAALPAGASAVPLGTMTPPATSTPPAVPGAPSPGTVSPPPVPTGAVATPPPPVTTPPPNTGFVAGAAGAPPPPPPVTPPAQPVRVMTAAANGATYESFIASGWTDALLIQHGMMLQQ